jgi:hypothetical protein
LPPDTTFTIAKAGGVLATVGLALLLFTRSRPGSRWLRGLLAVAAAWIAGIAYTIYVYNPAGDAGPLDHYIRFYYVSAEKQQRTIEAGYVSRSGIEPSKRPVNPIVIVKGYDDVPAWYDAGCAAIRVSYKPQLTTAIEARCDPSLELYPPSLPGWMYALAPLAPLAALLYFGTTRWLPYIRARRIRASRVTPP